MWLDRVNKLNLHCIHHYIPCNYLKNKTFIKYSDHCQWELDQRDFLPVQVPLELELELKLVYPVLHLHLTAPVAGSCEQTALLSHPPFLIWQLSRIGSERWDTILMTVLIGVFYLCRWHWLRNQCLWIQFYKCNCVHSELDLVSIARWRHIHRCFLCTDLKHKVTLWDRNEKRRKPMDQFNGVCVCVIIWDKL